MADAPTLDPSARARVVEVARRAGARRPDVLPAQLEAIAHHRAVSSRLPVPPPEWPGASRTKTKREAVRLLRAIEAIDSTLFPSGDPRLGNWGTLWEQLLDLRHHVEAEAEAASEPVDEGAAVGRLPGSPDDDLILACAWVLKLQGLSLTGKPAARVVGIMLERPGAGPVDLPNVQRKLKRMRADFDWMFLKRALSDGLTVPPGRLDVDAARRLSSRGLIRAAE